MGKLPKKYIKAHGGINKKAWAAYKKTLKGNPKKSKGSSSKTTKKPTRKSGGDFMNFNLGGGMGKGLIAGVAVGVINKVIPVNIAGADYVIAGMLMNNKLMKDLGFITLGRSLAGSLTGGILGGLGGGGNDGFQGY